MTEPRHLEYELSEPVSNWLRGQGYTVYAEVCLWGSPVDLIAKHPNGRLVAVELKRTLTTGQKRDPTKSRSRGRVNSVVHQACSVQSAVDEVYVAIATKPKQNGLDVCARHGLGVLRIGNGQCSVLLEPNHEPSRFGRDVLLEMLTHCEPGGIGGKPTEKGTGPAQDVARAVVEYRKTRPKATWKELFANVPNHYSTAQSMGGSLNSWPATRQILKEGNIT